ncbi:unnamed protein product, partial [Meganyctiphanes norvegica]
MEEDPFRYSSEDEEPPIENIENEKLYNAAMKNDVAAVRLSLENGADVNSKHDQGRSSLYIACKEGHRYVVQELLEAGVEKDNTASNGWTPLHTACTGGHLEIIKLLLAAGANKDKRIKKNYPCNNSCARLKDCITKILL